jgi:murein DD-endopeptidase MepM/ murein hydrolase activator NlpD
MNFFKFLMFILIIGLLTVIYPGIALAEEESEDPYYIVQTGDSLWEIAWRFGVTVEELQSANEISDPGQLALEARLVIPGLEGIQGRVGTTTVTAGESLRSFSRRYGMKPEHLGKVNQVINPTLLYAGEVIVVPADADLQGYARRQLKSGESLLELAAAAGENPWRMAESNYLHGPGTALPGDVLLLPGENDTGPAALSENIKMLSLEPLSPVQGKTVLVYLESLPDVELTGTLAELKLNFFPYQNGYMALQGIPAMLEPGLYELNLEGEIPAGEKFSFSQTVLVRSGNYLYDPPLLVDPETLLEEVVSEEEDLWASLALPFSPDKMWEGGFIHPVPELYKDCWTSLFGSRRSYNGSEYRFYHAGLDFCGREGTELYAPALGRVVFTGSLVIRGDVVVLDHGWGVYTAYAHLSETLVSVGETVTPGQTIGKGGSTGRSTGPHLHWEVWVGGYPVDPVEWLERVFP